jgi:hypothetical protein
MNIEKEIIEIKAMLKTLVEQTAPPPPVKTKVQLRAAARELFADKPRRQK